MQPATFLLCFFVLVAIAAIPYAYWELKHGFEAGIFVIGVSYVGAIFFGVLIEMLLGLTNVVSFSDNHIYVVAPIAACFLHSKVLKILRAKHDQK